MRYLIRVLTLGLTASVGFFVVAQERLIVTTVAEASDLDPRTVFNTYS